MMGSDPARIPIFPLAGAILLPRAQLPLHIFEDRYRDMVRDAVAGQGRIGGPRGSRSASLITYQWPVLAMLTQGSAGGKDSPSCSSSIDTLSGERTKAM